MLNSGKYSQSRVTCALDSRGLIVPPAFPAPGDPQEHRSWMQHGPSQAPAAVVVVLGRVKIERSGDAGSPRGLGQDSRYLRGLVATANVRSQAEVLDTLSGAPA